MKFWFVFVLVFVISFMMTSAFSEVQLADDYFYCDPDPNYNYTCTNCSFFLNEEGTGGLVEDGNFIRFKENYVVTSVSDYFFEREIPLLEKVCTVDNNVIFSYLENQSQYSSIRLEPLERINVQELENSYNNYTTCSYWVPTVVGEYVVVEKIGRGFCYEQGGYIPEIKRDRVAFYLYQFSNNPGYQIGGSIIGFILMVVIVASLVLWHRHKIFK